jgi:S-DNA-T family DNA segregation ATPase FtsK/SpoIIIE
MKDLVDDGPSEPLFTPSVMPEAEPVRQQPAPQAYAQPQHSAAVCATAAAAAAVPAACATAAGKPDSPAADA